MGKTSSSAWKSFERRVAKFFRTIRTPLSGGNSKVTRSDTFHSGFFVECKLRQKHAHHTLFAETRALADKEGKIPVVVTQQKYSNFPLVIINMEDLPAFCRKFLESRGYKVGKATPSPPRKEDYETDDEKKAYRKRVGEINKSMRGRMLK